MKLNNKKYLFYFGFLVLLGIVVPTQQAQAVVPLVGAGIAAAVVYVAGWVMQAVSMATAGLVSMASLVLQWVLGLAWPYTSGGIVDIGWPIARDLANIFFVVVLVIIGIATALRLEGYQAKKALPTLIFIILLINFTPVIAGLIVDGSNIVMNFFIEGLDPGAYFDAHLSAQRSILPASIWEALNPFTNIEQLLGSLAIIIMDLLIFFILQVFAILFLVRYVAIWILVILSPIAFASYVIPATRSFWKLWWNQFFQWCIFGVIAGFFLYLGTQFLGNLDKIVPPTSQGFTGPADVLINLMPLLTVGIFYIIGLFVSFSASAMGAKQVMGAFKKGGQATGKVLATSSFKGAWGSLRLAAKSPGTYQQAKRMGMNRRQAFGEVGRDIKRWVRPKPPSATREATWKETGKYAAGNVFKTAKGAAKAGFSSTFGLKLKKKGKKECPNCHSKIAANAKSCPTPGCGYSFE